MRCPFGRPRLRTAVSARRVSPERGVRSGGSDGVEGGRDVVGQ